MDPKLAALHLAAALAALQPADAGPLFGAVLDRYERERVPALSKNAQYDYRVRGRLLRLTELPDLHLGDVTIAQVREAVRISDGPAARAVLGRHVARVFAWAIEMGLWSGANPAESMPSPSGASNGKALDEEDARRLLVALRCGETGREWTRRALVFALHTGWRSGETCTVRREWIRPARTGGAWVDLPQTKSGPQRRVISTAALEEVLAAADGRENGRVFAPETLRIKTACEALRDTLRRALVRAQLPRMRVHDLRHTAVSLLQARGVAIADVAALVGHDNVRSTLRYSHGSPRRQQVAIEQLGLALARTEDG